MAAHSASVTFRSLRSGSIHRGTCAGALGVLLVLMTCATSRGQTREPQRIITVIPAVTEILFAVGAGPQLVGIGSFDTVPEDQPDVARVGGLLDPDMEHIFALRPDLVILYASQTEQRQQLERAGVPVMSYSHSGLSDIAETIRLLGERTGHAGAGREVASRLEQGLDAVRAHIADRPRPRTLLVFAREPRSLRNMYASGGVGFLHDMLEAAGGDNVFTHVPEERVAQAGVEVILSAAPDVIIEIRNTGGFDEATIEQERAVWERLAAVPAVRAGAVHFLNGSEFVVPGPRVLDAVEQLARLLHPEAF